MTSSTAPSARFRRPLVALVAAGALALSGCADDSVPEATPGQPGGGAAAAEAPDQATVEWTGSLCGALEPTFGALGAPPAPDPGDLEATRQAYLDHLGRAQAAAEESLQQVQSLEAPPVEGGQEVVDDVQQQLTDMGEDLTRARSQLEQAQPGDVAAIGDVVTSAGNAIGALGNNAQVRAALSAQPEIAESLDLAEPCAALPFAGGGN